MKKIALLTVAVVYSFILLYGYFYYENSSYNNLLNSDNNFLYSFDIPNEGFSQPENIIHLKKAAINSNVNILRTVTYFDNKRKKNIVEKYVFLSTSTELFKNITLSKGSFLNSDEPSNNSYLSTLYKKDINQVGVISDFGGSHDFSVYNIDELVKRQPYYGSYKVECDSEREFESFVNEYIRIISNEYGQKSKEASEAIIISFGNIQTISEENSQLNSYIYSFSVLLIFFIFMFYIVYETKSISIMKANGYRVYDIKFHLFNKAYLILFIFFCSLAVFSCILIRDCTLSFIVYEITIIGVVFIITLFIVNLFANIYIRGLKVNFGIKGKQPIIIAIGINMFTKIIISIFTIALLVISIESNLESKLLKNSFENWEIASEYGAFSPIKSGDEIEKIRRGEYPLDVPLYNFFLISTTKFNAIYINSNEYSRLAMQLNEGIDDYIRHMKINTQYLKRFPIYDEYGNQIIIPENTEETILLVPKGLKDYDKKINNYFSKRREIHHKIHLESHIDSKINSTKINTIYYNDRNIFSFNKDVFPENNNEIPSPIIMVLTINNVLVPDTVYAGKNPSFFIPLEEMDPQKTYAKMHIDIRNLSLADNLSSFVRIDDFILKEISSIEQEIAKVSFLIFIFAFVLTFINSNFILLLFKKNRFQLFVKKTMGCKYFMKYGFVYSLTLIANIVESYIVYLLIDKFILVVLVIKIVYEYLLITILARCYEGKSVVNVIKEGL